MHATSAASPVKWDEKPYNDLPSPTRMTKASVEFAFKGQLDGQGQTEYLMFYSEYNEKDPHKATAVYLGLTRFKGSLNGKSGSFVMEEHGTFREGVANSVSTIVAGSGTEQLKGITGTVKASATQQGMHVELKYELT